MIWIVGVGYMGVEYARALNAQGVEFAAVGRGIEGCRAFERETGIPAWPGGLEKALSDDGPPRSAIVAVDIVELAAVARDLVDAGCQSLLIEKPAGSSPQVVRHLSRAVSASQAHAYVAYNRRFYASTLAARQMVEQDGGATSFTFDFTEWAHEIRELDLPSEVLDHWILANSSHVIDLAFHLGGSPAHLVGWKSGSLDWHPAGAVFAGSGTTGAGLPFSYHADWGSAGRWGLEVMTRKRRFIFRPLEELRVQELGSVNIDVADLDYSLDRTLKPGLSRMLHSFLGDDRRDLPTLAEHARFMETIEIIREGTGVLHDVGKRAGDRP